MKIFTYKGVHTRQISFPLGGIGSGCIGLDGGGRLVDWEIFNRPAKGSRNGFSHIAVKAEAGGKLLDARVLHGDEPPPFSGVGPGRFSGLGFGVARETMAGLPHFRSCEFRAGFPFAELRFQDPAFPGRVTLEAFNPFIPLNDRDSSLPAAFFTVAFSNPTAQEIDYTAAFTVRNPAPGGTANRGQAAAAGELLIMTGDGAAPETTEYADFALGAATGAGGRIHAQEYWYRGGWFDNLGVFWQDFAAPGELRPRTYPAPGRQDHGTLAVRLRVPAGGRAEARFVFAWNVPNCRNYWQAKAPAETQGCCAGGGCGTWKNYYATLFPDAAASAAYALENWPRLATETRRFRDTLFSSTLPAPLLDAVSANISILKTPTCLRLTDGSFYGWEGCHPDCGCCEGSCTHVWNYAYALPFLFPALERSMRELDYRHNLQPDGRLPFRLQLPLGRSASGHRACADGQFGGVVKVYREWKISGDTEWLRRLWPAVRLALEYAWAPGNADRWDPDKTGVLHGRQHHTLDMELFGPNAWLTGFYLAALKAGAEMAAACGEPERAAEYREIFARGRAWTEKQLFNGEYFIQQLDLADRGVLAPYAAADAKIEETYWSAEHGELKYQIGEGCGIDQVLAQWHADLVGLGEIFPPALTRAALQAVFRHNFRASMRDFVNPCRLYCLDDEAGTLMFSWPAGRRKPVIPVPYAEETMHGFEYQLAAHLIMHGMADEGVRVAKAVRDRYDGERRNPWNEIECGSNYARSMASYALLNAASGFSFDMTRREIGFRPAFMPAGGFRCFWSLAPAWGEIRIRPAGAELRVLGGSLPLAALGLPLAPAATGGETVAASLGRRRLACRRVGDRLEFTGDLVIPSGTTLRVRAPMRRV